MKILEWFKSHPLETGAAVIGGVILIYLISRSGSSSTAASDVAAVANSQLQQASLANQNAATQAAATVQENNSALAAQVQNNTVAAQLAATVEQTQAAEQTAQLAAGVQNNTTNAQAGVANNTINAELTAQQSQVAAESAGLETEFSYLEEANNNQTSLSKATLDAVTKGGNGGIFYGQSATTNEALLSALALAQPGGAGTVPYAEGALNSTAAANYAENASIWNTVTSSISKAFTGLFG